MAIVTGISPPVISGIAKTTGGDVLENTAFTVTKVGPGTAAVIYSDPDLTTLITSPVTDANGKYQFYARNGTYQVTITDSQADNPPPITVRGVGQDGSDVVASIPSGTYADASATIAAAKRPVRTISRMVTALQPGHGYTGAGTGATWTLNDTADFCWGTQSAKVVTGGNAAGCTLSKLAQTAFDITGKVLVVPVKVSSIANLSVLVLYLGSSSLANNYMVSLSPGSIGAACAFQAGEWFPLVIDLSEAVVTGSPALNNITDVRWSVKDDGTTPITAQFQGLALAPDSSSKFASGVVTFSADDGYAAQYTLMRPVLDSAGAQATLHIIADTVGTSGVLTLAQLKTMQSLSGFEVGGHAYYLANHNNGGYPAQSLTVVEDDLRKLRDFLSSNGFMGLDFAWPGGLFDPDREALVLRYFNSARVTQGQPREFYPPNARGRLRVVNLLPTKTLAQAKADVDRAFTYKQWLNFTIHDMTTGTPTGNQWLQSDFSSLVAYIQAKPMPIMTTGDVLAA